MVSQLDRDAEVLVLRHVLEGLWANFLANSGGDILATTRRVAEESLASLESIYARDDRGSISHELLQLMLHHEESFWKSVEKQVAVRQSPRGARRTPR